MSGGGLAAAPPLQTTSPQVSGLGLAQLTDADAPASARPTRAPRGQRVRRDITCLSNGQPEEILSNLKKSYPGL